MQGGTGDQGPGIRTDTLSHCQTVTLQGRINATNGLSMTLLVLVALVTALSAQAPSAVTPVFTANSRGTGPLDRLAFRQIGPGAPSGRIDDLAVLESDPATFYVATATGGVHKTTNNGTTFTPVFDHEGTLVGGRHRHRPDRPEPGLGRHRREQQPPVVVVG